MRAISRQGKEELFLSLLPVPGEDRPGHSNGLLLCCLR